MWYESRLSRTADKADPISRLATPVSYCSCSSGHIRPQWLPLNVETDFVCLSTIAVLYTDLPRQPLVTTDVHITSVTSQISLHEALMCERRIVVPPVLQTYYLHCVGMITRISKFELCANILS